MGKVLLEDFLHCLSFLLLHIYIFFFFLNIPIQWEAGARIWFCSFFVCNNQEVHWAEFSNVLVSTGGFTISLLCCHVENLQYFFPWLIRLLVASKLWP